MLVEFIAWDTRGVLEARKRSSGQVFISTWLGEFPSENGGRGGSREQFASESRKCPRSCALDWKKNVTFQRVQVLPKFQCQSGEVAYEEGGSTVATNAREKDRRYEFWVSVLIKGRAYSENYTIMILIASFSSYWFIQPDGWFIWIIYARVLKDSNKLWIAFRIHYWL